MFVFECEYLVYYICQGSLQFIDIIVELCTLVVWEPIVVFDSHSLDEIDKTYKSIADLGVKLKALQEENSRHGQVVYHVAILQRSDMFF